MANLDGTGRQVSLGQGISLRAPGLRGSAEAHNVAAGGDTRAPEADGSGPALDAALTREGFLRLRVITLDVAPVPHAPAGDGRSPVTDVDGLEVTVPDLGEDVAQVMLAVDENGAVSWNFPIDSGDRPAPTTRGSGGSVRFIVPAFAAQPDPGAGGANRSVFGLIGRKVLELVALPLAGLVVPPLAGAAARLWESKSRIARARTFTPANYTSTDVPSLGDADWQRLAQGRSLWFVHGTFVNTPSAFQAFPPDVLASLSAAYGGRVAALDHHTLGASPVENADLARELIPDGLELDVDIVCHSRGGLVSRALAGQGTDPVFNVRRIVHVASANHGTALATPSNLVPFIDRVTTMVNLLPDGPAGVVVEATLTSVLVVVKIIATYGLTGIPGLAAMDSAGDFLSGFNSVALPAEQFAVAADYSPSGGWRAMAVKNLENTVVDRVFGTVANDLVVPTAGVYEGDDAMVVPENRRLVLPRERGVYHGSFFGQPDVARQIAGWLTG
ncbi:esterase/lipase family protein [Micropruina sp.]|uniref:esterase/lipase family protein n=1 Tax=Micropruina sp. TaxID=2737536 RepID=UPI0039E6D0CD